MKFLSKSLQGFYKHRQTYLNYLWKLKGSRTVLKRRLKWEEFFSQCQDIQFSYSNQDKLVMVK